MKASKVIIMTRDEQGIIDEALSTLESMSEELKEMAEQDDNISWLATDCDHALACLADFKDSYEQQFIKPKDDELD